MTPADPLFDLAAWLRTHRSDDHRLTLDRPTVRGLQAELQRLRQSNDRLRRQNRRLRRPASGASSPAEAPADEPEITEPVDSIAPAEPHPEAE